jgi:hypothetical protein
MGSRRRMSWMVLMAIVAAAIGCVSVDKEDYQVRAYLKNDLVPWLTVLGDAVCNIEPHVAGLPPADRICPNGKDGGGDRTSPPPPPPPGP